MPRRSRPRPAVLVVRLVFLTILLAGGLLATTRTTVRCARGVSGAVTCSIEHRLGEPLGFAWRTRTVENLREVVAVEPAERSDARRRSTTVSRSLELRGDTTQGHDELRDLAPLRSFLAQPARRELTLRRPLDPRLAVGSALALGLWVLTVAGLLIEKMVGAAKVQRWFGFDSRGRDLKPGERPKPWQRAVAGAVLAVVAGLAWFFFFGGHRYFSPRAVPKVRALHAALEAGDLTALERVLARGVDPDAPDNQETPPLWVACRTGSTAAVRLLLAAGADPNLPNLSGELPLHRAVSYGDREMVRALLAAGADPQIPNAQGLSLWELAEGRSEILGLLAEHRLGSPSPVVLERGG